MWMDRKRVGRVVARLTVVVLSIALCHETHAATPSSMQIVAAAAPGSAKSLTASFPRATVAGDVVLVAFDFDSNVTVSSISDSQGNVFTEVGSQLTSPGGARSRVYFAKSIKGGPDTVTVTLSGKSSWIELYLSEYSGIDPVNPIDAQAGASGNAGAVSSGSVTTTVAGDVIYGFCVGDWACTVGSGLTARSTFNNNLVEDKAVANPGSYAATASATKGWTMQLVALKAAATTLDVTAPSIPANLSATGVSPSQINISWSASTDNVGVRGYQLFRNGVQIGTTATTSFVDSNLAASTTYSYNVTAFDAAGNVSAQSSAAVATTSTSDTTAPTVPANLSGTSTLSTQVSLSWGASTDNIGVAGYRVSRNSVQVGTTASTTFVDTGLIASTTYSYTVAAFDAAGNVSAASSPFTITTAPAPTAAAYPVKLSSNGRYLVDQNNTPFFIVGDAPQLLFVQPSPADVDTYLADRQARGFNALWVYSVDSADQSNAPANFNGDVPFDGAAFTNFDPAYWAYVDSVMTKIQAKGMIAFVDLGFVSLNPSTGYENQILASSDATMTAYGTFLGNRYKNFNNIVWVIGGDADPSVSGLYQKLNDIGNGLAAADPNHLITLEACRICTPNNQSTINAYGGAPPSFIDLNWVYNMQTSVVAGCQAGFASAATAPPLMGEDWYELEHSMTGFQERQEAYWEVLSGCYLGRIFGNEAIYSFNSPNYITSPTWQSQLGSTGSVGQQYLGQLMRSREHWLMAPDVTHTVLTAGFGAGSTLSVAARSSDGQTIIAYFPDGNATTKSIDLSKITSATSSAIAWWYNPQTGASSQIGAFATNGLQSFTAPDGNDWVLVIDDASANLGAPGSGGSSQKPGAQVTALTCAPSVVASGGSSTCAVALSQTAPAGGTPVALTDSNTSVLSVPASVMVASGASTGTFVANAAVMNTPQSATVTATLGTSSSSATVSVQAPVLLTSLTCAVTGLNSGAATTCTVTLNQPAPSGGATVSLTNSNTAALAVPGSVTVSSGATTATFSASAGVVTASQSATVTATLGTSTQSIQFTIVFSDSIPPTVSVTSPTSGQTVSGTFTLSASASDNLGIAWVQYKVDGATVGTQITTAPYNYSLVTTSLTNATHTVVAVASDLSGNTSTSATISFTVSNSVSKPAAFVQIAAKASPSSASSLSVSFATNTVAGDVVLAAFDFDSNATVATVTDSQGNVFTEVGTQLTSPGGARSRVYFAKSIKGGPETVTVSLTANSAWIELYLSEYSGIDPVNPIDAQAGASGNPGAVSSGNVTTTVAGDVIYGFCVGEWACTVGSGLTARSIFNNNLVEDKATANPGSYAATGTATKGWTMQLVALKKSQ